MKVNDLLKRKGKFVGMAALAVCGAVVLACYGHGIAPSVQQQTERAEAVQVAATGPVKARYDKDGFNVNHGKQLASLRQPKTAIGEMVTIDSDDYRVPFNKGDAGREYGWDGTMEFTVLSAGVYDSIDDVPISKGQANGFVSGDIARDYEKDGGYFLLYEVKVHNVDAKPVDGKYLLSTSLEPSDEVGATDPVYLDCADAGAINPEKPEYVRVAKGKTETFTCGWAVMPGKGGDVVSGLDFDPDGLNSVSLAGATDNRVGNVGDKS